MSKEITYTVGTMSSEGRGGITWEHFKCKRDAVQALAGAFSIQKVKARTWVIKRGGR